MRARDCERCFNNSFCVRSLETHGVCGRGGDGAGGPATNEKYPGNLGARSVGRGAAGVKGAPRLQEGIVLWK